MAFLRRAGILLVVVVLAFGLFHLEMYETFLWSGASMDHHMIILLAAGVFAGRVCFTSFAGVAVSAAVPSDLSGIPQMSV